MKTISLSAVFVAMFCWLAWAADAAKELEAAAKVLQNMTSSNQIPSPLLKQTKCIAVIQTLPRRVLSLAASTAAA
jgi:hypothetical protein